MSSSSWHPGPLFALTLANCWWVGYEKESEWFSKLDHSLSCASVLCFRDKPNGENRMGVPVIQKREWTQFSKYPRHSVSQKHDRCPKLHNGKAAMKWNDHSILEVFESLAHFRVTQLDGRFVYQLVVHHHATTHTWRSSCVALFEFSSRTRICLQNGRAEGCGIVCADMNLACSKCGSQRRISRCFLAAKMATHEVKSHAGKYVRVCIEWARYCIWLHHRYYKVCKEPSAMLLLFSPSTTKRQVFINVWLYTNFQIDRSCNQTGERNHMICRDLANGMYEEAVAQLCLISLS